MSVNENYSCLTKKLAKSLIFESQKYYLSTRKNIKRLGLI